MNFIVRFAQSHETFRLPELKALAHYHGIALEVKEYDDNTPFSIVSLSSFQEAKTLVSRAILVKAIYHFWGTGTDYDGLHRSIRETSTAWWAEFENRSFKFEIDGYHNTKTMAQQKTVIEGFSYMDFSGPIRMKNPDETFCVFEEFEQHGQIPKRLLFGRLVGQGNRDVIDHYSLKKRTYISTTSMDAELALVTANITCAGPGKIFYDPFMGTGSFPIACSHFGALSLGSDIDGRSIRGAKGRNVVANFKQYNISGRYLGGFASDLTHSPLDISVKRGPFLDSIICDPPYGVREGVKVLGQKDGGKKEVIYVDGIASHLRADYVPPKRAYGFDAILEDILEFASLTLVEGGRLSIWLPTANDENIELAIPVHPALEVVSVAVQAFNKWSRRLVTYARNTLAITEANQRPSPMIGLNGTADDLNTFRRRYFQGFRPAATTKPP